MCQHGFFELKKRLCELLTLGYPDRKRLLNVNTAIGGILSLKQGDHKVVTAYFSKWLLRPEQNYCVTIRKLLAVVQTR